MEINDELIERLSQLSKLDLSAEEREGMKADFQRMLDFVDVLRQLDTEGVEPLIHMTQAVNQMRKDESHPGLDRESFLGQAPEATDEYFRVPKVVKREGN